MDRVIEVGDKLYALATDANDENKIDSTEWYGKQYEPLQGSRMHYNKKSFKNHKHKLNPRIIPRTQECFVVIRGEIQVDMYNDETYLGTLTARAGEVIFVWDGFHKLSIVEDDTLCYEIKCGQFTTVQDDKILKEF